MEVLIFCPLRYSAVESPQQYVCFLFSFAVVDTTKIIPSMISIFFTEISTLFFEHILVFDIFSFCYFSQHCAFFCLVSFRLYVFVICSTIKFCMFLRNIFLLKGYWRTLEICGSYYIEVSQCVHLCNVQANTWVLTYYLIFPLEHVLPYSNAQSHAQKNHFEKYTGGMVQRKFRSDFEVSLSRRIGKIDIIFRT